MKILHIIDHTGIGGAQTLLKEIFEHEKNNKNIFCCVLRNNKIKLEMNCPNLYLCKSYRKFDIRSLFKLKKIKVDKNFIRFIAFVNSEGTLTETRLTISQKEERELLTKILKYLKKLGYRYKVYNSKDYRITPNVIARYLFHILGGGKSIKEWVFFLPTELKKEYLRWFFSLDGSINFKSLGMNQHFRIKTSFIEFSY